MEFGEFLDEFKRVRSQPALSARQWRSLSSWLVEHRDDLAGKTAAQVRQFLRTSKSRPLSLSLITIHVVKEGLKLSGVEYTKDGCIKSIGSRFVGAS